MVSFTPRPLYSLVSIRNRKLGEPASREDVWEKKKNLSLAVIEPRLLSGATRNLVIPPELSRFYDRMTEHRNRFLVNKTNRRTKFQFYWYYFSTCFGQPFCPSSGVLSCTSALVHCMQL